MTDAPKHYTIDRPDLTREGKVYIWYADGSLPEFTSSDKAIEAAQRHADAVVADSPELAEARAQIAALKAEVSRLVGALELAGERIVQHVTERDAALAEVVAVSAAADSARADAKRRMLACRELYAGNRSYRAITAAFKAAFGNDADEEPVAPATTDVQEVERVMTATDPSADEEVAWKVAIALACASNLRWGFYARGYPGINSEHGPIPPVPWDADAYLDDCARRGVEPGQMPSLFGVSSGVSWSVDYADGIHVVFHLVGGPAGVHAVWFDRGDRLVFFNDPRSAARSVHPREIVGTIHCLATAAKRSMEIGKKFFQEVGA